MNVFLSNQKNHDICKLSEILEVECKQRSATKIYSQNTQKNIHPTGESEVSIYCVIKGLTYRNMVKPLSALPMKASDP